LSNPLIESRIALASYDTGGTIGSVENRVEAGVDPRPETETDR
jgi:hypothetical protein